MRANRENKRGVQKYRYRGKARRKGAGLSERENRKKRGRKQWLGDSSEWAPARCMLIGEQVLGLGAGG